MEDKNGISQWVALVAVVVMICVTPVLAAPEKSVGTRSAPPHSGIAADNSRGEVVDPTKNVLDLVRSAIERQDDLRVANEKYVDAELRHVREMAEMRAEHAKMLRDNDKVTQEKVREVDVLGGRTEADRAGAGIKALAESGSMTAETLRKMVETTASTLAAQNDARFSESNKRIQALELALSEGRGKQTMSDPMLIEMVAELKSLRNSRSEIAGKGEGSTEMWGYVVGGIGLVISILGAFGIMLGIRNRAPVQGKGMQ